MHKLLVLFCLLSVNIYASGKISVQANEYWQYGATLPQIGFNVRESIFLGWEYDGFIGMGHVPYAKGATYRWLAIRNDMQKWFGDLGITLGVAVRFSEREVPEQENDIHVKFTYKLWD